MPPHFLCVLSLFAAVFTGTALSSAYYNNEFFTRITKDEVDKHWTNEVDAHSFIKESFSFETVLK